MAISSFLLIFVRYIRSSFKLTISAECPEIQLFFVIVTLLLVIYVNYTFHLYTKRDPLQSYTGVERMKKREDSEDIFYEEDIEIPQAFRKEYNFLRENAKSLTTLFENYIQKRVSHDTLLRQFQASQENTFLQMKSRVRSDLELPINLHEMESIQSTRTGDLPTDDKLDRTMGAIDDIESCGSGDSIKRTVTFKMT